MRGFFNWKTDGDAAVLGPAEKGFDGDSAAAGLDAGSVLLVGILLIVPRIEAADAVEVVASAFPQGVGKGEANAEPVVVSGRDVNAGFLDAARDLCNLILQ